MSGQLPRTLTAGAALFHPPPVMDSGSLMQRSQSTVIHRTRRGHSVIKKTVQIERMASEKEVEQLAQSSTCQTPLSNKECSLGSSRNSTIFNNLNPLGDTMLVCEEGTSSDEEEENEAANNQSKKSEPIAKKPASKLPGAQGMADLDAANVEAEILDEIQSCILGKKSSCNLSRGAMARVPTDVSKCINIKEISLCDNQLVTVDGAVLAPLVNLVKCSLSNNPELSELPIQLFQLPMLETLLVDRCQVSTLPIDTKEGEAQLRLPSLVTFGAEWNQLKVFPFALLHGCPNLSELFLAENPEIQELPGIEMLTARGSSGTAPAATIKCRVDNRPKLMAQVAAMAEEAAAYLEVTWNKIYPDKVLDFLYLGSLRTAQCPEVYQDLDIGFILTAGRHLQVRIGESMEQLELGIDDLPGEDMKPFFKEAFEFIERARIAKRGILIHCFAGMSRSVTFTAAYLMHTLYPMTRDESLELIRKSRPAAQPNAGFMQGLLQWEEMLRKERGDAKNGSSPLTEGSE